MSFRDLEEFLDPTLKLPIRGKTYVVQSPDAKTGLWVQGMMTAAAQIRAGVNPDGLEQLVLDDDEERDAMERVLGATFAEMVADQVPWAYVKHAGTTVMLWVVHGKDAAESFWNGGSGPKAPKKKRRKGGAKKARPASAGTSTTTPASSVEKASPGATSSSTGS